MWFQLLKIQVMKKILIPIFISASLFISGLSLGQQSSITIGVQGNSCDQLIIEWSSTYNFVGAGQNQWTQSTFTIAWPQALGANTLGSITSLLPGFTGWQYNGAAILVGAEYRREIILISGGYQQDIPTGITEVIEITLEGSGTGDFNLSLLNPAGQAVTNISSGNFAGEMWTGSFSPSSATGVSLDDKIVWNGTEWCGGSGTNNQPGAGDTKPCFITGLNGHLTQWGATVGALTIQAGGEFYINPGASLTNSGNTTISQPAGLIIAANATGSGSYMDNGIISYTNGGSAKVQTYIQNTAVPGDLHIHQIGPTVKNPSFSSTYPGESGVFLSEFDLLENGTYAYRYDEPTNNWENIYENTEPVPTGAGFIFSDVSGSSSTLEMIGQIATDDNGLNTYIATPSAAITPGLAQWAVTFSAGGGQGNYLTSNPYPSGLDLNDFWLAHPAFLGGVMRIWDPIAGSYATMTRKVTPPPAGWLYTNGLVGTNGKINPGQAFFIETLSTYAGTYGDQIFYVSSYRDHYYGPFLKNTEESTSNSLRIKSSNEYYSDEAIIYFAEGASSDKDDFDAVKWASMYEHGMDLSSLSTDNVELTVNVMPEFEEMISIPVNFKTGISSDFTFTFSEMETFETGTEIFLEDKKIGGNWINLISNPVYEFIGDINDAQDRFIIHFFGPTGIEDPLAEVSNVQIYSWGQDAYIVNRGNETIKEYVAYDLMGRELHRGTLPNSTVNKVQIGDVSAYYIVKVITREGTIYTDKVYITK
jgi:hypothetical protein